MENVPLFRLAQANNLPLHQFMDRETLDWIVENKPTFTSDTVKLPPRKSLEMFVPPRAWFLDAGGFDSIHGVRHMLRVAVNVVLVAKKNSYAGDLRKLIVASVLHDIRRNDDKSDASHGKRAADWFRQERAKVEKQFGERLDNESVDAVYWLIYFHELPAEAFTVEESYQRFKEEVDIMRIADALDRYRLPKTKWWINEEKLGLVVPPDLKKTAFNLMVKSEENFLNDIESEESVLGILP